MRSDEVAGLAVFAVGPVVVGVLCLTVARLAGRDALPRNGLAGIRTSRTRRSDAAWVLGHRAAGPWLTAAGVVGVAGGVATPAVAATTRSAAAGWWTGGIVLAALVVALVVATVVANRAAVRA